MEGKPNRCTMHPIKLMATSGKRHRAVIQNCAGVFGEESQGRSHKGGEYQVDDQKFAGSRSDGSEEHRDQCHGELWQDHCAFLRKPADAYRVEFFLESGTFRD